MAIGPALKAVTLHDTSVGRSCIWPIIQISGVSISSDISRPLVLVIVHHDVCCIELPDRRQRARHSRSAHPYTEPGGAVREVSDHVVVRDTLRRRKIAREAAAWFLENKCRFQIGRYFGHPELLIKERIVIRRGACSRIFAVSAARLVCVRIAA